MYKLKSALEGTSAQKTQTPIVAKPTLKKKRFRIFYQVEFAFYQIQAVGYPEKRV